MSAIIYLNKKTTVLLTNESDTLWMADVSIKYLFKTIEEDSKYKIALEKKRFSKKLSEQDKDILNRLFSFKLMLGEIQDIASSTGCIYLQHKDSVGSTMICEDILIKPNQVLAISTPDEDTHKVEIGLTQMAVITV